jgi:hypothetical protein
MSDPERVTALGPEISKNKPYAKAYSSDSYYDPNPNKGSEMN